MPNAAISGRFRVHERKGVIPLPRLDRTLRQVGGKTNLHLRQTSSTQDNTHLDQRLGLRHSYVHTHSIANDGHPHIRDLPEITATNPEPAG